MTYTTEQLRKLLKTLISSPHETEWIEFKHNRWDKEEIGSNLSALANSAHIHQKEAAFIAWGVKDKTHEVIGTTFKPKSEKIGNQELESWLINHLTPRIDFTIYEFTYESKRIILFEIKPIAYSPVRFKEIAYIRVGSYTKRLTDYPEKEKLLWQKSAQMSFEKGVAKNDLLADEVLSLIDYPRYFELSEQSLPSNKEAILQKLAAEKIIQAKHGHFSISNLGAMLFAKRLSDFDKIGRKAVRVIIYKGINNIETIKEHSNNKGYANGFQELVAYINDQIPRNEQIGQALRKEVKMYPEIAIRELVANAIIHQDFSATGSSPTVSIFNDRIEITNYGKPLIDTLRFIDEPPQSRNEDLAAFMRRLHICEERGSGMKKIITAVEAYQLPAPAFVVTENHTKTILYAYKRLADMDQKDKIRACYQHACLCYVSNTQMTNASLRKRFAIEENNAAIASRIIASTVKSKFVKPSDSGSSSRKHIKYVPFWA